jgi:hypothetical protein
VQKRVCGEVGGGQGRILVEIAGGGGQKFRGGAEV